MIRDEIKKIVENSLTNFDFGQIKIERTEKGGHGDYSTNFALLFAKQLNKKPIELAKEIKNGIEAKQFKIFEKIEVIEPGFINFFIAKEYLKKGLKEILEQKEAFGSLKPKTKLNINIEFISANPTGPLTLGNGRGGFCGDVLANILKKAGHSVIKEYYINDIGNQIKTLGHSVLGDVEAVYRGEYIDQLRKKIKEKDFEKAGQKAAVSILKEIIKPTTEKMGIIFDFWFSEKSLYQNKETENILKFLEKKGLAYKKDNALWFKSSQFGDDKDRVLVKADGEVTYLASDIAYLKNKIERGFDKLVYFWGADHYGYIERIKAAGQALGFKKEMIKIIIMQLVRLFDGDKEVRMSKRSGNYLTIDELIDEVGLDATRFFFLTKNPETHFNFDIKLAKEQSEKNPVYYLQYAHARISSIIEKSGIKKGFNFKKNDFKELQHPAELRLIKRLLEFPEIIEDISKDYQIQKLPQYSTALAADFHQFYSACHVLIEEEKLRNSRISLAFATKIILKNSLDLMGITSPEKM